METRRRKAASFFNKGLSSVEIAEKLSVHRCSVDRWRRTFKKEGVAGLKSKQATGRPMKLNLRQLDRLKELLASPPSAAEIWGSRWNSARIAELIYREFGVQYRHHHMSRLLRKIGRPLRSLRN